MTSRLALTLGCALAFNEFGIAKGLAYILLVFVLTAGGYWLSERLFGEQG